MTMQEKRIRAPQQTRKAVLRAAEKLFAKSGYAGTSMREISMVLSGLGLRNNPCQVDGPGRLDVHA